MMLLFSLLPRLLSFSAFPGQGDLLSFHLFCALCPSLVSSQSLVRFKLSPQGAIQMLLFWSPCVSSRCNPTACHLYVAEQIPILVQDSVMVSMTIFPTQLLCHFPQEARRKGRRCSFTGFLSLARHHARNFTWEYCLIYFMKQSLSHPFYRWDLPNKGREPELEFKIKSGSIISMLLIVF